MMLLYIVLAAIAADVILNDAEFTRIFFRAIRGK